MIRTDPSSWAIAKLTKEREKFLKQVEIDSFNHIQKLIESGETHSGLLEKGVYNEIIRVTQSPWKIDPPNEKQKWYGIRNKLLEIQRNHLNKVDQKKQEEELIHSILNGYSSEIAGKFDINTYNFAVRVVPLIFSRLLNTASNGWFRGAFSRQHHVQDRINMQGDIKSLQALAKDHTIILVPTHFSNLDSVLIGYGLDLLGLPAFLYGAGLNLYNNKLVGYFINRLGAYKLDRRKKNQLYLETLKSYSRIAMQRGCHSLFFPGGTRSRSGGIENKLKLGLLGTVLDAQIHEFKKPKNAQKKLIIVPLVLGYHFVLEASSLINEHLKSTGQERYYIENDQFSSYRLMMKFLWDFFSKGSKITLSFGKPMDVFGNYVDDKGTSFDFKGSPIDIRGYFKTNGEIYHNPQRDQEYTRMLGDRIIEEYFKYNVVLSSHMVAFAYFQILRKKYHKLSLYDFLRLPLSEREIPYETVIKALQKLKESVVELSKQEKIKMADHCYREIENVFTTGVKNLGLYHIKKVMYKTKENKVSTEDLNLLYFYNNRLVGYNFENTINFSDEQ